MVAKVLKVVVMWLLRYPRWLLGCCYAFAKALCELLARIIMVLA